MASSAAPPAKRARTGDGGGGESGGHHGAAYQSGRYDGKVAIVTGGAKGIGEGVVRAFHRAGAFVVIADIDESAGPALAADLWSQTRPSRDDGGGGAQLQGRAAFIKCDVTDAAQLQALVDAALGFKGRIDCVVNNAGWHPPAKTIDDTTAADCRALFELNFFSGFILSKLCLPHLRKVKGNIINISSWVGVYGQDKAPSYVATKGALTAFSKALAIDEAPRGVRVNVVSPGNVWTPLWKSWADGEADPAAARAAGDTVQVMRRKGTIAEAGKLCLYLAADATFTTGVDHVMSGGAELGYGVKGYTDEFGAEGGGGK